MVRTEALFSQLVFDHAIRVRVNTASMQLVASKRMGKTKTADSSERNRSDSSQPAEQLGRGSSSSSRSTSVAVEPPRKSIEKEIKTQAGSLSNLLTVDLDNLAGRIDTLIREHLPVIQAFCILCTKISPVIILARLITALVLLCKILGWR